MNFVILFFALIPVSEDDWNKLSHESFLGLEKFLSLKIVFLRPISANSRGKRALEGDVTRRHVNYIKWSDIISHVYHFFITWEVELIGFER